MTTLRFALFLILAVVCSHAENQPTPEPIKVLGSAIRHPQPITITQPTPLSKIVDKCGGLLNIWGGIITITKKESDVLVTTRRYQFQKLPKGEERTKIFSEIMISPGEVVTFHEIYD